MFFKKKRKKVTWKKDGEFFYVYINGKELPAGIPCHWSGNDMFIFLEVMNKYYLLQGYKVAPDQEEFEAVLIAEGYELLWQKQDDGYFLYENGETISDNSDPYWIEDLFLVAYNNKDYLLKDFKQADENEIYKAALINDEMQVTWINIKEHFYLIANKTLDLNHIAHHSKDDLVVYVDDLEAIMKLPNYNNSEDYVFYEATRVAEKNQFIYRKGEDGFYLYRNEKALHMHTAATFVNDDILVLVPDFNTTLLFVDYRHESEEYYNNAEILESNLNAFWCADEDGYYLIDKGVNISKEIGSHTSRIGNNLLLYHSQSSTTYLFENYLNLRDGKIRSAYIMSYTADFIWTADEDSYKLWYRGQEVGECEHQLMGNDLMVMPKSLKILVQIKDFVNCQDNKLRAVEST